MIRDSKPFGRGRTAFTLIELLIVVAIVAIIAASSIAVITAPAEEQKLAEVDRDLEAGAALFFSTFVPDAHEAGGVRADERGRMLALDPATPGGLTVIYFVDARKHLRRAELDGEAAAAFSIDELDSSRVHPYPALLSGVDEVSARFNEEQGMWRISLQASAQHLRRTLLFERSLEMSIGRQWAGRGEG